MKCKGKVKIYVKALCFTGQDAIKCVIRFRIIRHTIKREIECLRRLLMFH
jgi:hypothetical protein